MHAGVETDGSHDAVAQLGRAARSAPEARRFVHETLRGRTRDDTLRTVELLACELVTNAVVHARSEVELRLRRLDGRVRLEVADRSPAPPRRRDSYGTEALGGHGMLLVEELADDWGVARRDRGKVVWCEVRA
jgi:anti-sigma regulatory factor (Ser/Thr protein kinase)